MATLDDCLLSAPPIIPITAMISEALTTLGPARYGVVMSADSDVLSVITAGDLTRARQRGTERLADRRAGLPPAVVLRSGTSLADLARDDAVTLLDLMPDWGAAAVVGDADDLIGVFPIEVFDRYLSERRRVVESDVLGIAGYGGDGQAVGRIRLGLARVICAECGHVNEILPPFDPGILKLCSNPAVTSHPLEVAVGGLSA